MHAKDQKGIYSKFLTGKNRNIFYFLLLLISIFQISILNTLHLCKKTSFNKFTLFLEAKKDKHHGSAGKKSTCPLNSIPRTHTEEEREMTPSHVFDMSAHTISGRKVGLVGE